MDAIDQIILDNYNHIIQAIKNESLSDTRVIAVTKYAKIEWVKSILNAGITDIAENQVQQSIQRFDLLKSEELQFTYHYIGPIQTNKIRQIVPIFDWVQTICRIKEVEEFDNEWTKQKLKTIRKKINCCIQINIGNEPQKNGVSADLKQIKPLADRIVNSESMQLRGLMTIPPFNADDAQLIQYYEKMLVIYNTLKLDLEARNSIQLDTLSMGMSNDYLKAIAHGATCVRIGTAFFSGLA